MRELSLHILDLIQNSLEAGARHILVEIVEDTHTDLLTISIADDGRGMDEETARRASDPYFTTRTTRHVGLGLPLFRAAAERCNGSLVIESQPGKGTRVVSVFQRSHLDRAPLGDMQSTLLGVLLSLQGRELGYVHRVDERIFGFDTRELREVLGTVPLDHPAVRDWIEDYLGQEGTQLSGESIDSQADEGHPPASL